MIPIPNAKLTRSQICSSLIDDTSGFYPSSSTSSASTSLSSNPSVSAYYMYAASVSSRPLGVK